MPPRTFETMLNTQVCDDRSDAGSHDSSSVTSRSGPPSLISGESCDLRNSLPRRRRSRRRGSGDSLCTPSGSSVCSQSLLTCDACAVFGMDWNCVARSKANSAAREAKRRRQLLDLKRELWMVDSAQMKEVLEGALIPMTHSSENGWKEVLRVVRHRAFALLGEGSTIDVDVAICCGLI